MAEFAVTDEVSLGDAVWRSKPGDLIRFLEGTYGRVVVKGCNVLFPEDGSVKIGQLVGYGGAIRNATMADTIKSVFYYRKILPINLRIKPDYPIFHPTGAAVTVLGHDKEPGGPITTTQPAREQLPRAIVQIEVPRLEEIDFDLLRTTPESSDDWQQRLAEEEKLKPLLRDCPEGFPFGDVEYIALWTLNHFLRQYATVADLKFVELSFADFRDQISLGYGRRHEETVPAQDRVYIDQYHAVVLTDEEHARLQELCFSAKDYSVSEYVLFALERLNYSMATIGMAQMLESNGLERNREWDGIRSSGLDADQQRYLAEVLLCRNQILHTTRCAIERDTRRYFDQAAERFGATEMSEYRIYATKRPWSWYFKAVLPYCRTRGGGTAPEAAPTDSTITA